MVESEEVNLSLSQGESGGVRGRRTCNARPYGCVRESIQVILGIAIVGKAVGKGGQDALHIVFPGALADGKPVGGQAAAERDPDGGAPALPTLQQQGALMQLGHRTGHRQPQAGAGVQAACIKAVAVPVKDRAQLLRRDAAAVIIHGQDQVLPGLHQAQAHPGAALGVDDAVGDQVQHHQLHQLPVGRDGVDLPVTQAEVCAGTEHTDRVQQAGEKADHIHLIRGKGGRTIGDGQHQGGVGQHPQHPVVAVGDGAQILQEETVTPLLSPGPEQLRRDAEVHQGAAHGTEQRVIEQQGSAAAAAQEDQLAVADMVHPEAAAVAADGLVKEEGGGLGLTQGRAQQVLQGLALTVIPQKLPGGGVGEKYTKAPGQQRRLAGQGKDFSGDLVQVVALHSAAIVGSPQISRGGGNRAALRRPVLSSLDKIHNTAGE